MSDSKQATMLVADTMASLNTPQERQEYVAILTGIKIGAELSAADKKEAS